MNKKNNTKMEMKKINNTKMLIANLVMVFAILFAFMPVGVDAADSFDYGKLSVTLLNQDPDPATPGEYVELRFKVEKSGNDLMEDVEFLLKPEHPFFFDNGDTALKEMGNWVGNSDDDEYFMLYYKLRVADDAIEGDYDVTLVQKSTTNKLEVENEFTVRVGDKEAPELNVGSVRTSPAKLIANYDEGLVEIEIVNNGDYDAKQVIVDMDLPDGFTESFGYSSRVNLGTIPAGSSKLAKFYMDTEEALEKGSHESLLRLTYKDDTVTSGDKIKKITLPFDVKIFGRPEYKINDFVAKPLKEGQKGTISFSVENIGSRESDTTSVQIFKDSSQPFDFEDKSDFVGRIDVGESGEVVFNYEVKADAVPKDYKLKLQVRSVVDGDVLVEDEIITVNVLSKKAVSGDSAVTRYFFYLLFVLVGVFIGMKIKTKKNSQK